MPRSFSTIESWPLLPLSDACALSVKSIASANFRVSVEGVRHVVSYVVAALFAALLQCCLYIDRVQLTQRNFFVSAVGTNNSTSLVVDKTSFLKRVVLSADWTGGSVSGDSYIVQLGFQSAQLTAQQGAVDQPCLADFRGALFQDTVKTATFFSIFNNYEFAGPGWKMLQGTVLWMFASSQNGTLRGRLSMQFLS